MNRISETADASLWGVYLHIPYCRSRCAYCNFVSGCDMSDTDAYVKALIGETERRGGGKRADTVYIGGGTPSVLPRGKLKEITDAVRRSFELSKDSEISIECNPDSASKAFFDECAECGVNRVSIGLQSTSDRLLRTVGRPHDYAQFLESVNAARAVGITNINADLMLNLPDQTVRDVTDSIDKLSALPLTHISVYGLSVEKGTPLEKSGYVPDEDRGADMYDAAVTALRKLGYVRYEVSNFALKGRECRHNLKYWDRSPYVGLGLAAHSFDGKYLRSFNTSDKAAYIGGNTLGGTEELTNSDAAEEYIMLSLRTAKGLDLEKLRLKYGVDLIKDRAAQMRHLMSHSLVEIDKNRLLLTDKAYYIMNSVIVSLI